MRVDGDKHTWTSAAELTDTSAPPRRPRRRRQTETAAINQIITYSKAMTWRQRCRSALIFRGIFEKCFLIFAEISIGKRPQFKSRILTNFQFLILFFWLCWWNLLKRDDNKKIPHVEVKHAGRRRTSSKHLKMSSQLKMPLVCPYCQFSLT